jgi:hypothetical protein
VSLVRCVLRIRCEEPDGAGFDRTVYDNLGGGHPIPMEFGPSTTKDLYKMTFGGGQVRRIAYNPGP